MSDSCVEHLENQATRLPAVKPAEGPWPRLRVPAHLLLACVVWTGVGVGLLGFGTLWTLEGGQTRTLWLLPVFLGLGVLKGEVVLRRTTRRFGCRIRDRKNLRWVGGFLPLWLWLAIGSMIFVGRLLRVHVLPRDVAGLMYLAVGLGLLLSSRHAWAAWWGARVETVDDSADRDA